MKKSTAHGAMERHMTNKSKKSKKSNNKEFLSTAVVVIVALFFASGVISFLITSPSIQNLATVMPQNPMRMMQSTSKPFISSFQDTSAGLAGSGPAYSVHEVQVPSPGNINTATSNSNIGHMFAHAFNARVNQEEANKKKDSVISLDSDFALAHNNPPKSSSKQTTFSNEKMANYNYNYNYYYFDSSSQAFHLHDEYTTFPDKPATLSPNFQRSLALSNKYLPSLCNDGITYGFSDLATLRNAIHELNVAYSDTVSRWKHYHSALSEYKMINELQKQQSQDLYIESPPPLPSHLSAILEEEPDPFVICPHTTLRSPLGRYMPININAEDVLVECDSCVIDTPGTHFSFGQHAKNVHIKGITLMGATESSIVFRHNGADVIFEDCYWVNNNSVGMHGAVADMNSTSTVQFYSCEISDVKHSSPRGGMQGAPNTAASSLTLRG